MKVSIDLDGTLWRYQDFFRRLMISLQQLNDEVGILTGHKQSDKEKDYDKLFKNGFPYPNFYFGRTPDYMHLNGAHYKTMIIKREGIDIHFDDYDYDNADTERLFKELGEEGKIFRVGQGMPR